MKNFISTPTFMQWQHGVHHETMINMLPPVCQHPEWQSKLQYYECYAISLGILTGVRVK